MARQSQSAQLVKCCVSERRVRCVVVSEDRRSLEQLQRAFQHAVPPSIHWIIHTAPQLIALANLCIQLVLFHLLPHLHTHAHKHHGLVGISPQLLWCSCAATAPAGRMALAPQVRWEQRALLPLLCEGWGASYCRVKRCTLGWLWGNTVAVCGRAREEQAGQDM